MKSDQVGSPNPEAEILAYLPCPRSLFKTVAAETDNILREKLYTLYEEQRVLEIIGRMQICTMICSNAQVIHPYTQEEGYRVFKPPNALARLYQVSQRHLSPLRSLDRRRRLIARLPQLLLPPLPLHQHRQEMPQVEFRPQAIQEPHFRVFMALPEHEV